MAVELRIEAKGVDFVRRDVERLRRAVPRVAGTRIRDALERARKKITKYPPERPGQTYRRTGTYRRAWRVKRGAGFMYSLVGQAIQRGRDYTKFVGGDAAGAGQAWFHAGRWTQAKSAVDNEMLKLPASVRYALLNGYTGDDADMAFGL